MLNIKRSKNCYAPIKRWQRYAEATSYQRQPVVQMIELSNLQEIEVDELITQK